MGPKILRNEFRPVRDYPETTVSAVGVRLSRTLAIAVRNRQNPSAVGFSGACAHASADKFSSLREWSVRHFPASDQCTDEIARCRSAHPASQFSTFGPYRNRYRFLISGRGYLRNSFPVSHRLTTATAANSIMAIAPSPEREVIAICEAHPHRIPPGSRTFSPSKVVGSCKSSPTSRTTNSQPRHRLRSRREPPPIEML